MIVVAGETSWQRRKALFMTSGAFFSSSPESALGRSLYASYLRHKCGWVKLYLDVRGDRKDHQLRLHPPGSGSDTQ